MTATSSRLLLIGGSAGVGLYDTVEAGQRKPAVRYSVGQRALDIVAHPWHPTVYLADARGDGHLIGIDLVSGRTAIRPSGGTTPCHLALAPGANHLVVANYSGGTVGVHSLDAKGNIGPLTQRIALTSSAGRTSHPHHVEFDISGQYVFVTDLGADVIRSYRFASSVGRLIELTTSPAEAPTGSGPRSLARDRYGFVWCSNELSSTVTRYHYDPRTAILTALETWSSSERPAAGANFPGAIISSVDGRFMYVANRGHDTIAVFAADPRYAGFVFEIDSGGSWPADLAIHGATLFVANRDSDVVCLLPLSLDSGLPDHPRSLYPAAQPTCLQTLARSSGEVVPDVLGA